MTTIALGCYTQGAGGASATPGRGIALLGLNFESLEVIEGPLWECESPSYVLWHPNGDVLYACHEVEAGAVSAVRVTGEDPLTMEVAALGEGATGGAHPCHLALVNARGDDPLQPTHLVVSNYSGGSFAVFALGDDGTLRERTALVAHEGASVHAARQESPHVHQCVTEWFVPESENGVAAAGVALLHVVDLGLDVIRSYRLSPDGSVAWHGETTVPPGAGPRQMLLDAPGFVRGHETPEVLTVNLRLQDPDVPEQLRDGSNGASSEPAGGGVAGGVNCEPNELVLGELDSQLYLTSNGQPCGAIRTTQVAGENLPAHVAAVGHSIVVSNRGADTLAFIRIDGGSLALTAEVSVGSYPRHFEVVARPDVSHILVSNQLSNSISVVRVEHAPGAAETAALVAEYAAESPTCIAVRPA